MIHWRVVEDYGALSRAAAALLLEAIEKNPRAVLGLPTGSTPEGMYAEAVAACLARYRCFAGVTTFNLDEYVGIGPEHPGSYHAYMASRLFNHVDVDSSRTHLPDGIAAEARDTRPELDFEQALEEECRRYEAAIRDAGGLQLTFLGVGRNGHIGFNEPGSPFDSRTRVVTLHEGTRRANARFFPEGEVPERAITVGIGTILESHGIVLLASGEAKAEVVARLHRGEISTEFPASALVNHPRVLAIVDRAALTASVDLSNANF